MLTRSDIIVLAVDYIILNLLCLIFHWFSIDSGAHHWWYMTQLFYTISLLVVYPTAQKRFARVDQVFNRVVLTVVITMFLILSYIWMDGVAELNVLNVIIEAVSLLVCLFYGRYGTMKLLKHLRAHDWNTRKVVFVGAGRNNAYLYSIMHSDKEAGYSVIGYFENHISTHFPESLPLLGSRIQVTSWLADNHVDQLYCCFPNSQSREISDIISYCDNHFIRFFSVPNVYDYFSRSMVINMIDDMPVLTLRKEPLAIPFNRFVKRTFDIVFSGLFLLLGFWWIAIIVAIITKITMPGPVFFRQKRTGLHGDEFSILKFRSMRVNNEADTIQATKDDPRTTRWGEIMRKTNIDELPQFVNVFLGSMSVVGPRPHMLAHTEQYSALIEKYMVRHIVKPGITGWAQTHGARGETEELWQMEDRVQKDVWYIERWSLGLDLRIIYQTLRNIVNGDKQAY